MKTLTTSILLLLASVTAPAQVTEAPISTIAELTRAAGKQTRPLAASNGTDFLVAWMDVRGASVYTARVKQDGTVLDRTGNPLPPTYYGLELQAVLWCGNAYVLVLNGSTNYPTYQTLTAVARIDVTGRVLEAPHAVFNESARATAATASRILIVGEENFAVLDDQARFVEQSPIGFTRLSVDSWTAASNGSSFLVVAKRAGGSTSSTLTVVALDASGRPKQTSSLSVASPGWPLAISAGKGYNVFLTDYINNDFRNLEVKRFAVNDGVVGPLSLLVDEAGAVAATETDSGYLVAALGPSNTEIQIVHVTNGTQFSTWIAPATPNSLTLACNGRDVLVAWADPSVPDEGDLRGVIVGANGTQESPLFDVTESATEQLMPAIATGGVNDLVTWQEGEGYSGSIYAARVTREGVPLDGRGIQISPSGNAPQVVFDSGAYVVAWEAKDWHSVNFQWVHATTGSLLARPVRVDGCMNAFHIGRDDIGVVLFATTCDGRLIAQRVSTAGAVGPAVFISPEGFKAMGVSAAFNGQEWLVSWNDAHGVSTGSIVLPWLAGPTKVQRVSESLSALDSPIEVARSDSQWTSFFVASDGKDFVVAWSKTDADGIGNGVYARTISSLGSIGDPMLLALGDSTTVRAAVWDGSRYAVAYIVSRPGVTADNLEMVYIGSGDRVLISATPPYQIDVSLAVAPGRAVRAAYARIAMESTYGGVSRAFIRDLVQTRRRSVLH